MTNVPIERDVDRWIRELLAAGWKRRSLTTYEAPNGTLFLGPHGAWKAMKEGRGKATS